MKTLLIMPIVVPLLTAILSLLTAQWPQLKRPISVLGALGLLGVAIAILIMVWNEGILAVNVGNWPAPFGIAIVADLFSAIMVVLTGIIGAAVVIYSLAMIDPERESLGYHPLLHVLLMGVCGAFLTGDIFNLYVWFEVMLIASFVLMVLGSERAQIEGAIKYVTLNLISSAIFLSAVGVLYGLTGTLNMADIAVKLNTPANTPIDGALRTTLAMMFMICFGIKAAVFPLFFWLPASYHTPPAAVSAIFAGLLTKVGVYALIRVFTLIFIDDVGFTHTIILVCAGLTMVTGVLGAAAQHEFRRILSFHIISQIGYMIMGLGLFTIAGIMGSVLYIMHHIIVKTNLFLVSGVVHRLRGTYELKKLGNLYAEKPLLAAMFLIPAMSLAGMPPLSGFFAKLSLIQAGLQIESFAIVATALVVGLLTLYSMTKIWQEAFWKPDDMPTEQQSDQERPNHNGPKHWQFLAYAPIIMLAVITLSIGLWAQPFIQLATRSAEQLMNPQQYIDAVLNNRQSSINASQLTEHSAQNPGYLLQSARPETSEGANP
jgi:multicomponent Na+:H+ antiporter subunit D